MSLSPLTVGKRAATCVLVAVVVVKARFIFFLCSVCTSVHILVVCYKHIRVPQKEKVEYIYTCQIFKCSSLGCDCKLNIDLMMRTHTHKSVDEFTYTRPEYVLVAGLFCCVRKWTV
jgi:hypothetical protein